MLLLACVLKLRVEPYDQAGTIMDLWMTLGVLDVAVWCCGDG